MCGLKVELLIKVWLSAFLEKGGSEEILTTPGKFPSRLSSLLGKNAFLLSFTERFCTVSVEAPRWNAPCDTPARAAEPTQKQFSTAGDYFLFGCEGRKANEYD